jgi:hypothetical protein
MSAGADDKSAIVKELYSRIDALPKEKQGIVRELAGRYGLDKPQTAPKPEESWLSQAGRNFVQQGVGIAKSVGKTAQNLSDIGRVASGGAAVDWAAEKFLPGGKGVAKEREAGHKQIESALEPKNEAQSIGLKLGEFAQYFIPIGTGEIKAAANAPKWIKLLTAAGRDAVDVGLKTFAQTKDPQAALKSAGLAGAVSGGTGAALSPLASMFKKWGVAQYARLLHPMGRKAKEAGMEAVPKLLDAGAPVAASQHGLQAKLQGKVEEIGKKIEAEYAKLDSKAQTNLRPIYDDFGKFIEKRSMTPGGAIKDPDVLKEGLEKLDYIQSTLGPRLSNAKPSEVWEIRKTLDRFVYKGGELKPTEVAANSVVAGLGNSMRDALNTQHPTVAALNEKYHMWSAVAKIMQRNITNEFGKPYAFRNAAFRFMLGASIGAGEAHREGSGWMGTATAATLMGLALESTAWRSVSAVTKNKIADMLMAGNGEAAAQLAARVTGASLGASRTAPQPSGPLKPPEAAKQ